MHHETNSKPPLSLALCWAHRLINAYFKQCAAIFLEKHWTPLNPNFPSYSVKDKLETVFNTKINNKNKNKNMLINRAWRTSFNNL